jgi:hypothetical protein
MNPEELGVFFPVIPHPLRCQTCKNIDCWYYDPKNERLFDFTIPKFTSEYGCASHSSAQLRGNL